MQYKINILSKLHKILSPLYYYFNKKKNVVMKRKETLDIKFKEKKNVEHYCS